MFEIIKKILLSLLRRTGYDTRTSSVLFERRPPPQAFLIPVHLPPSVSNRPAHLLKPLSLPRSPSLTRLKPFELYQWVSLQLTQPHGLHRIPPSKQHEVKKRNPDPIIDKDIEVISSLKSEYLRTEVLQYSKKLKLEE